MSYFDTLVAITAWAVTSYKAHPALRGDRRTHATWAFMFWFATSLTLKLRPVSLALDHWTGVANLAWLLSYLAVTLALYRNVVGCQALLREPEPRWLGPSLVGVWSVLGLIFVRWISTSPEYPDHTLPRTLADVLFMNTTYLYCALLLLRINRTFARLTRLENQPLTLFRWRLIWVASLTGSGFCWTRSTFLTLAFLQGSQPLLGVLDLTSEAFLIITCLMWPLFGLSARVLAALTHPLRYVDTLLALREVRYVQRVLQQWFPAVVKAPAGWPRSLWSGEFYLYEGIIAILDGQKILTDYVAAAAAGSSDTGEWTRYAPDLESAQAFLAQLPPVAETGDDYAGQITASRALGQSLRRERVDRRRNQWARHLSRILHPFSVCLPALLVTTYGDTGSWSAAFTWTGVTALLFLMPLSLFVLWKLRTGGYRDADVRVREARHSAYVLTGCSLGVLLGVALLADAPRIVTASVLSIILVAVGGGVLNHFDKVSVHVMVTVSCATLLMTVLWPAGLLMGWGAVLVSWARIQLQCHTLRQVVEGWLIALLSAGGVWMVYLR